MTKLYTASRFGNYARVRAFNEAARAAGHEVTHDWTTTSEFGPDGHPLNGDGQGLPLRQQAMHATLDLEGVASADMLVLLPVDNMGGAYIEIGYALALDRQIWIAGPCRFTVFWALPRVIVLPDEAAAREALGMTPLLGVAA